MIIGCPLSIPGPLSVNNWLFKNLLNHLIFIGIILGWSPFKVVQRFPFQAEVFLCLYSKTCLKWPLKIDKTKVLMTNGSLMKVESIASFDLH